MSSDEAVDLSKNKSVGGAKDLETSDAYRTGAVTVALGLDLGGARAESGGGDEKGDAVVRVRFHDVVSGDRRVELLPLFAIPLLYHQRRCVCGLAIPHFSLPPSHPV